MICVYRIFLVILQRSFMGCAKGDEVMRLEVKG